jgi:hypothetical protein
MVEDLRNNVLEMMLKTTAVALSGVLNLHFFKDTAKDPEKLHSV